MSAATRAYYVTEWWRVGKAMIVYADTAEEAKQKVRHPSAESFDDIEVIAQVDPVPKGIEVRREPRDDRPDCKEGS